MCSAPGQRRLNVVKNERVRIVDIAEELGLSTATVSNVLHGKTKKISDETVKRVQELLEKREYMPGMADILLAQNNSRIIGVVVNDHEKYEGHVLEDGFVSATINTLSREIDKAGYFMMVKPTTQWDEIVRFASMWNMEGLVIIGFCEQDYKKLRECMRIPFVAYEGYFQEAQRICNLTIDNYGGGYQAGQYLKSMGHEKVLCISDNDESMDSERIKGFMDAMGALPVGFMQTSFLKEERMRFYEEKIEEILEYTAIFALSDYYAIEIMNYLKKHGVRVPEDISIMGFDDSPLCHYSSPALTTMGQGIALRAKKAIEILLNLRNGSEKRSMLEFPVKVIERESVKNIKSKQEVIKQEWRMNNDKK